MSIEWKNVSEIPGYEWIEGYRVGYDEDSLEDNKFILQSRRIRTYIKGKSGAVSGMSNEWHDLKLCCGKAGYLQSNVYTAGRKKTCQIHQLGYLAFGPPRPSANHWVLHRNDIKTCNNLDNLYWGTSYQNIHDAIRNGGFDKRAIAGELPQTKLTIDQALEIYRRAWLGENSSALALEFGISQPNVSMIKHKKSWKHMHDDVNQL